VIKFVVDLLQVSGFLRVLLFPPPIKLTRHDITAILLKMALNTISLNLNPMSFTKKPLVQQNILVVEQ
jgi:hypothetical protein